MSEYMTWERNKLHALRYVMLRYVTLCYLVDRRVYFVIAETYYIVT